MKEFMPIASFLVTLTLMDRVRRTSMLLAYRMVNLWKLSGPVMATQYLKEATRLVVAWMAGTPEVTPPRSGGTVLVKRDSKGLPTIIPTYLRQLMLQRDVQVIRLVLSILGLHRVIRVPMTLKIGTITAVGPVLDPVLRGEILVVMSQFFGHVKKFAWVFSWRFSVSAGPNNTHATRGAPMDAAAMLLEPKVLSAFVALAPWYISCYMISLGIITYLFLVFTRKWKVVPHEGVLPFLPNYFQTPRGDYVPLCTGRLSVKLEACGKARVFAITDWWTQGLLYQLHTYLFGILRGIRQDGTFDQAAPFNALKDRVRLGQKVFSFDLSAATDRLPVWSQEVVLGFLCGFKASFWTQLLVSRLWHLVGSEPLRYGVGQPMGAYSSWAMLALTHHVLVQVAAMRAGWKGWFPFYAILGDDVVIVGEAVATEYHNLMTHLGVSINLAKSIVSEGGLIEFAKRLETPFISYSPISSKGLLAAFRNGLMLPALYLDMIAKGFEILPYQILGTLQKLLLYYSEGAARAKAYVGFIAVLGPTGPASLPLADWIALRISRRPWGDWLWPGLEHALAWSISSIMRGARDSASIQVQRGLGAFLGPYLYPLDEWREWFRSFAPTLHYHLFGDGVSHLEGARPAKTWSGPIAAPGYPTWFAILTPGFWIYILTLYEMAMRDPVRISRQSVDLTSAEAIRTWMQSLEFDWGLLTETSSPHLTTLRIADLRARVAKASLEWSPDSSLGDLSLVSLPGEGSGDVSETRPQSAYPESSVKDRAIRSPG